MKEEENPKIKIFELNQVCSKREYEQCWPSLSGQSVWKLLETYHKFIKKGWVGRGEGEISWPHASPWYLLTDYKGEVGQDEADQGGVSH